VEKPRQTTTFSVRPLAAAPVWRANLHPADSHWPLPCELLQRRGLACTAKPPKLPPFQPTEEEAAGYGQE